MDNLRSLSNKCVHAYVHSLVWHYELKIYSDFLILMKYFINFMVAIYE